MSIVPLAEKLDISIKDLQSYTLKNASIFAKFKSFFFKIEDSVTLSNVLDFLEEGLDNESSNALDVYEEKIGEYSVLVYMATLLYISALGKDSPFYSLCGGAKILRTDILFNYNKQEGYDTKEGSFYFHHEKALVSHLNRVVKLKASEPKYKNTDGVYYIGQNVVTKLEIPDELFNYVKFCPGDKPHFFHSLTKYLGFKDWRWSVYSSEIRFLDSVKGVLKITHETETYRFGLIPIEYSSENLRKFPHIFWEYGKDFDHETVLNLLRNFIDSWLKLDSGYKDYKKKLQDAKNEVQRAKQILKVNDFREKLNQLPNIEDSFDYFEEVKLSPVIELLQEKFEIKSVGLERVKALEELKQD